MANTNTTPRGIRVLTALQAASRAEALRCVARSVEEYALAADAASFASDMARRAGLMIKAVRFSVLANALAQEAHCSAMEERAEDDSYDPWDADAEDVGDDFYYRQQELRSDAESDRLHQFYGDNRAM